MASASLWGPLEGIYLDRNTVNVSPKQAQKVRLPIGQLGTLTWAHSKDLSEHECSINEISSRCRCMASFHFAGAKLFPAGVFCCCC